MTRAPIIEVVDNEPLIVMTDNGTHGCEHKPGCEKSSRWYVECCPSAPKGDDYLPPVRYVCSLHVVAAFNELLQIRKVRRAARDAG